MRRRDFLSSLSSLSIALVFPGRVFSQVQAERVRILKDWISSKKRSHNYKKLADPTGSAPTNRVERFELRGGDCSNDGDCTPRPLNGRNVARARTERVLSTDMRNGDEGLFSYYLYIPTAEYAIIPQVGSTFGQLLASFSRTPGSDGRPICSLDTDERPQLYIQFSEAGVSEGNRTREKSAALGRLSEGSTLMDRWIKFEMYFKLSSSDDGFIEVRVNGKSSGRLVAKTFHPDGGLEVRYGIYQTGTNQYPGGAGALPPQVVYFSDAKIVRLVR